MVLLFQFFVHKKNVMFKKKTLNKNKKKFYELFKNLQPLSERASFKLSFDIIFITVGEKLVDEIDFEIS